MMKNKKIRFIIVVWDIISVLLTNNRLRDAVKPEG